MDDYRFRFWRIRADMVSALTAYVDEGMPLGDFLRAVVCNDLVEACGRADHDNAHNIPAFAGWLFNECPSPAWGSEAKYEAWIAMHQRVRQRRVENAKEAP